MIWSKLTPRIQQLEKLRENYQSNSQRIRDNYSIQVGQGLGRCSDWRLVD